MRSFFKEFKEFISRGNVIDLAVAVIIGSAFTAIVTALTSKIIMPLINWFIAAIGGKEGLASAYTILSPGYTDGQLDLTKSIYIDWGAFISAIINFILVAFVLFLIIKAINFSQERVRLLKGNIKKLTRREVKAKIRELKKKAKEEGVSFRTLWTQYVEEQKRIEEEEERKKEEEEKAKKLEEERKANEQTNLLREIRDLLKESK